MIIYYFSLSNDFNLSSNSLILADNYYFSLDNYYLSSIDLELVSNILIYKSLFYYSISDNFTFIFVNSSTFLDNSSINLTDSISAIVGCFATLIYSYTFLTFYYDLEYIS